MDYYEEFYKTIDNYMKQHDEIMNSLNKLLKDDTDDSGESKKD